jgi:LacI family transcriptional regulator
MARTGIDLDALFAVNDSLAVGALRAFREKGVEVPEDVSLIGFNNDVIDEYLDVPLTSMTQPKYEMGKKAVELLLERIDEGKRPKREYSHIMIKPTIVIRSSAV